MPFASFWPCKESYTTMLGIFIFNEGLQRRIREDVVDIIIGMQYALSKVAY